MLACLQSSPIAFPRTHLGGNIVRLSGAQRMSDLSQELSRNIPLCEMLQTVRQELSASMAEARHQDLQFTIEKIELELKIVVARETKKEGGVSISVLKAGGQQTDSTDTTHTMKLTLGATSASGRTLRVSDKPDGSPR